MIQLLALIYLGLLLLVFIFQRRLIYHPTKAPYEPMLETATAHGFQPWENAAGKFIGWKRTINSKGAKQRLLITHGNAGCAINRIDYADGFQRVEPWEVYILEYPGYGAREGSPSQKNIFQAAGEAMELLKREGPIYIMSESLGTGVACYLGATYPDLVKGLLLVAPYNNLTEVAKNQMRIFPVRWMLWDRFASDDWLKKYHGPVGMLLAGQDTVIPNRFGHRLYDGYQGPKKFWEIPDAGHNDLIEQPDEWWRELILFWRASSMSFESSTGKN